MRAAVALDQLFHCIPHPSHLRSTCRLLSLPVDLKSQGLPRGVHICSAYQGVQVMRAGGLNIRESAELLVSRSCETLTKYTQGCNSTNSHSKVGTGRKGQDPLRKPHQCSHALVEISYLPWSIFSLPYACYKLSSQCSKKV